MQAITTALAFFQMAPDAHLPEAHLMSLSTVDLVIIALYFVAVIGIGFYLKRFTKTGEDFFLAGREMTAWIAGLSFLAANLGSLELMGWAASSYQYGILAAHWYWIGAIPAMIFLALVMMPFYYISKTHSVPGYLKLRFGEPARWNQTLRSMLWTNATAIVPPFTDSTTIDLPIACTHDFNIAAAKYFDALEDDLVPLRFMFSGTIFHAGEDGRVKNRPFFRGDIAIAQQRRERRRQRHHRHRMRRAPGHGFVAHIDHGGPVFRIDMGKHALVYTHFQNGAI